MKTYSLTLPEIESLSDALAELDHGPDSPPRTRALVEDGHAALMRALGDDVALIYDMSGD